MTKDQATQIILALAARWGENAEEGFTRRVLPTDTNEQCAEIAALSGYDSDDVIEVRDLWCACELLTQ